MKNEARFNSKRKLQVPDNKKLQVGRPSPGSCFKSTAQHGLKGIVDTEAALKCPYFSHKVQLKTENIKINISKTPKVEEKTDKLRASKSMAKHECVGGFSS